MSSASSSAAWRGRNDRAGVGTVAEVLTGSASDKVVSRGLDRLKSYNLLGDYRTKQVIAMLHRLIESGLVQQVNIGDDPRFKLVRLTAAGVKVMKGQAPAPSPLADLLPKRAPARSSYSGGAASSAAPTQLDAGGQERFDRLRRARLGLASERGLPPYCICNDQTLRLIAHGSPRTSQELEAVKGMGPRKVAMYGDALLAALDGAPTEDGPRFVPDSEHAASPRDEWPSQHADG